MRIKPRWEIFWIVCLCWLFFVLGAAVFSWKGWEIVIGILIGGIGANVVLNIFRLK